MGSGGRESWVSIHFRRRCPSSCRENKRMCVFQTCNHWHRDHMPGLKAPAGDHHIYPIIRRPRPRGTGARCIIHHSLLSLGSDRPLSIVPPPGVVGAQLRAASHGRRDDSETSYCGVGLCRRASEQGRVGGHPVYAHHTFGWVGDEGGGRAETRAGLPLRHQEQRLRCCGCVRAGSSNGVDRSNERRKLEVPFKTQGVTRPSFDVSLVRDNTAVLQRNSS